MTKIGKALAQLPLCALIASLYAQPATAQSLDRLQSILGATPDGGWAKVSIGTLSSAFPTGADAVPEAYGSPTCIEPAWSSTVWDAADNQLLLWGGGHANYGGNEMYSWDASTGNWSRGSLPSALVTSNSSLPVVGNGAPESAHTYDGNVWLPVNKMFVTFGGATYPNGGASGYYDTSGQRTGPWFWDPTRADPNKVGGATGTGWDPTRAGGNMWTNGSSFTTGTGPSSWIYTASATRVENGQDVAYVAADTYPGVFATLYRYQVGNVRNGGAAQWSVVGSMPTSEALGFTLQGAAALDSTHNLFVRTGEIDPNMWDNIPSRDDAFIVWDLNNAGKGGGNLSKAIRLVDATGKTIEFNSYGSGIDFDSATGMFYLWSSTNQGQVLATKAQYDSKGQLMDTWQAWALGSTTSLQPTGVSSNGVLGKWRYVSSLNAFVALEEFNTSTGDSAVWLYKPEAVAAAVPEVHPAALLAVGLMAIALMRRRGQRQG